MHIAASITDKDIIGEIEVASSDHRGNTVTRFCHFNGKKFGLSEENYSRLRELAERIQSSPTIRSTLSSLFVEKKLFLWICNKFKGIEPPDLFIEYLDAEARNIVKTITSWIPIANLEVECSFPVSKSEIRPLSKSVIDKWENKALSKSNVNNEHTAKFYKELREKYQGLAAVVTVIEAEPEYASDYAMEEAQQIIAALGIFSDAMLIPDIRCASNIKGSENIPQAAKIFEGEEGNLKLSCGITDMSSIWQWRLDKDRILEIRQTGLDKISSMLAAESLKDFEKSVLNSIFLYSKSAFVSDPVEKVVYILSSLESILLKNENEPIQQNLAERIAVFTAQELDERKIIIKTIKSVYGIRSKYLHHGQTSSELKLISDFMIRAWIFFIHLLANADRFQTQQEFVNAIDDLKLS